MILKALNDDTELYKTFFWRQHLGGYKTTSHKFEIMNMTG